MVANKIGIRLAEEREVDAAVAAVLQEARMGGEVVLLAVLEHEDAALLQQVAIQDEVGDVGELGQRVGRVGKDEVELLVARLQEAEHVAADGHAAVGAKP